MLYLAIDLHQDQITINLRNEQGKVVQKEQVSTEHNKINEFFAGIVKQSKRARGYMAILEVCGFHEWLVEKLHEFGCREIVLVQPDNSSNKKTDRRDANSLGELLWNNRFHILNGERPNGLRRIYQPDSNDCDIRQLASLRSHLIQSRTKCINKIRGLLRKYNKIQDAPSNDFKTKKVRKWLETVELPLVDRFEVDIQLQNWKTYDEQILKTEGELLKRGESNSKVHQLVSIPGISHLGAIILLSRINDINRFKTPDSLANYFGLTPGCRNSGKSTQKIGGITKAGSSIARNVLNFAMPQLIRNDPQMKTWYGKIKRRKGAKTARVAVMRKLTTIIWHMLKWNQPYQFHYEQPNQTDPEKSKRSLSGRKRPQVLKA